MSAALEPFAADPDRVLPLLPQLKNPEARGRLVESTANARAQRDPIGAWVWAAQFTDPSQRKAFEDRLTFNGGSLPAKPTEGELSARFLEVYAINGEGREKGSNVVEVAWS